MSATDGIQISAGIDLMREYMKSCRKSHKKVDLAKMKFWAASRYDYIVQTERFELGLGPGRVGVDFIS